MNIGELTATLGVDTKGLSRAETEFRRACSSMSSAANVLKGALAALGVGLSFNAVKDYVVDVTHLAARYEELGLAMNVAGRNVGYSSSQIASLQKDLEAMGIASMSARQEIMRLSVAQVDLSRTTELVAVAQNLGVMNIIQTDEALDAMILTIQTGNERTLKAMGFNADFAASYEKLARSIGKTAQDLTEQEQVQARVNAIIKTGEKYVGLAAAAMQGAAFRARELKDAIEGYKIKLGEAFQPAYLEIIGMQERKYKNLLDTVSNYDFSSNLTLLASKVVLTFETMVSGILGNFEKLKKEGRMDEFFANAAKAIVGFMKVVAYVGAAMSDALRGWREFYLFIQMFTLQKQIDEAMNLAKAYSDLGDIKLSEELLSKANDLVNRQEQVTTSLTKMLTEGTAISGVTKAFDDLEKQLAEMDAEATLLSQIHKDLAAGGSEIGENYDWIKQVAPEMSAWDKSAKNTAVELTYILDGVEKTLTVSNDNLSTFTQIADVSGDTTKKFEDQTEEIKNLNEQLAEALKTMKEMKETQTGLTTGVQSFTPTATERFGGILPSFQGGGIMPGYSAQDRYLASFRAGEAFVPPESVDKYGKGFIQGLIDRTISPTVSDRVVLDLRVGEGAYPIVVEKTDTYEALLKELKHQQLVSG